MYAVIVNNKKPEMESLTSRDPGAARPQGMRLLRVHVVGVLAARTAWVYFLVSRPMPTPSLAPWTWPIPARLVRMPCLTANRKQFAGLGFLSSGSLHLLWSTLQVSSGILDARLEPLNTPDKLCFTFQLKFFILWYYCYIPSDVYLIFCFLIFSCV